MPLKITLKPGEKFAINGAVIANGDRRSSLVLQNKANILRERDILHQDEVNTPAKRIYFPIMMMYLDESGFETYYEEFQARIAEFIDAVNNPEVLHSCLEINRDVVSRDFYAALKSCRKLMDYESTLLKL